MEDNDSDEDLFQFGDNYLSQESASDGSQTDQNQENEFIPDSKIGEENLSNQYVLVTGDVSETR